MGWRARRQIRVFVGNIPEQAAEAEQDDHRLKNRVGVCSRRRVRWSDDCKQGKECCLSNADSSWRNGNRGGRQSQWYDQEKLAHAQARNTGCAERQVE